MEKKENIKYEKLNQPLFTNKPPTNEKPITLQLKGYDEFNRPSGYNFVTPIKSYVDEIEPTTNATYLIL